MRGISLVLFFFMAQGAFASSLSCAASEKNALTNRIFSVDEYREVLGEWEDAEPAAPGLLRLFRAYNLYQSEKPRVDKIRGDKAKHCFLGCRMAEEIDLKTAIYVAWYKEQKDLTDCNSKTLFEHADYDATVIGAETAMASPEVSDCYQVCGL